MEQEIDTNTDKSKAYLFSFFKDANNVLVQSNTYFHLHKNYNGEVYDEAELLAQMVRKKIIPRMGEFAIGDVTIYYHVHGSGYTFYAGETKLIFNVYPKIDGRCKIFFSCYSIASYIRSVKGDSKFTNVDFISGLMQTLYKDGYLCKQFEGFESYYIPSLS